MKHGVDAANSICEICSFSTDGQYPDFTKLYNYVNNLLFEKVISQIPTEIWTYILEYVCKSSRSYKYSHQWVRWTLVSHKFRDIVYSMKDIFFTPSVSTHNHVLVKFHNLETLRVACNKYTYMLPHLPKLTKVKYESKCLSSLNYNTHIPAFTFMNPALVPNLVSYSCSHSCLKKNTYTFLEYFPDEIKKRITKLRISTTSDWNIFQTTLMKYTALKVLKLDGGDFRKSSYKWFCPLLEELHVTGDCGGVLGLAIPADFTGKARIYIKSRRFIDMFNTTSEYLTYEFFTTGMYENGVKRGEWKTYNIQKRLLRTTTYPQK